VIFQSGLKVTSDISSLLARIPPSLRSLNFCSCDDISSLGNILIPFGNLRCVFHDRFLLPIRRLAVFNK
jgi:hypothetical protein